ncbi:MAG: T9SS type A sorting domain-containing protein [Bacteroidetes bacterium]|nr:T9SS type A sorting domain-containing protein [Bacteroidota bacterium]
MKKFTLLFCVLSIFFLGNAQNAQIENDPYIKTFILNPHYQPDANQQAKLRAGDAWQNFLAENGTWWVEFNEITGKPQRATGKGIATSGASVEERALNFLTNNAKAFAPEVTSLQLQKINTSKYYYVNFYQTYAGLNVLFSQATLRLTKEDYKVILFGLNVYSDISVNTIPSLSKEAAANYASTDFTIAVNSTEVESDLAILPIPNVNAGGYAFKLVYTVVVNTTNTENLPGKYRTLVDAHTGDVLYRTNEVHSCGAYLLSANADIQSVITDNPLLPTENRGLPYIKVTIDGSSYYADENGILNLDFITEPTEATVELKGLYAKVYQGETGSSLESISVTLEEGDNVIEFDTESGATASDVSAYYHQNIVHDYVKSLFPDFTTLDFDQTIRTDRGDGTCNAFYDGTSINFYANGGGCPATALFNDVVYHEYGHGINYDLYAYLGDPSGMNNGAMQEGYADIWGYTITGYPILAQGFSGSSATYIRRYDADPKVYPEDLVGEVHADGEIIAGAWWDLYENLDSDMNAMIAIWTETLYATSDGSAGTEGLIFRDVLLEALLADDDNADLSDGTPNDLAIIEAFAEHGITLLANAVVEHDENTASLPAAEPVIIEATLEVDFPVYLGDLFMYYRTSPTDIYSEMIMTETGATTYESNIGVQPAGTIVEYYFLVTDIYGGVAVTTPKNVNSDDPNLPFYTLVGYELKETEDFDNVFTDWEVDPYGDDDNTTGTWTVDVPIETIDGSYINQPGDDHTPGFTNLCAFTGNAPSSEGLGANDVDGGATSLRTPLFDVTDLDNPVLTYYRWYANDSPTSANPGNDVWQVYISNNETDWVRIERTYTSDNSWRKNAVRVLDYVEASSTVGLLFIAQDSVMPGSDLDGGSLVEAAIDDLQLWGIGIEDTVIEDTTGNFINAFAANTLIGKLYPNPANDFVQLEIKDFSGAIAIQVYNSLGELVLNETAIVSPQSLYPINISILTEGIYTVQIKAEMLEINKQLIIQHN